MAINTKVEWCGATWNPWLGCAKVSDGCKFCYAEAQMDKWLGRARWGPDGTRVRTSVANWKKPVKWNKDLACGWVWRCSNCNDRIVAKPLYEGDCKNCGSSAWRNIHGERVFCASLADVFEDNPQVEDWRLDLFRLIFDTPQLDWLLLTKRPQNVIPFMDDACWPETGCPMFGVNDDLPPNVWLGTSVENQAAVDDRVPQLAAVPTRVRFLSVEPLLEEIDFEDVFYEPVDERNEWFRARANRPDWVIVGGESGPNARPLELAWVRDIISQCRGARVPVFVKQLGSVWAKENGAKDKKGGDMGEWPENLRVREQPEVSGLRMVR